MIHVTVYTPRRLIGEDIRIAALLNSGRKLGFRTLVLAHEQLWTRYFHLYKILLLDRVLARLPEDEIVLFTDARDICFINEASEGTIESLFRSFGRDIVFSGERRCTPARFSRDVPDDGTPYRFLNSGAFIGYAGALRAVTSEISSPFRFPIQRTNDQSTYFRYYLVRPGRIEIDRNARLFLSAIGSTHLDVTRDRIGDTYSSSQPAVLHFNGDKDLLNRIFEPDDEVTRALNGHVTERGYVPDKRALDDTPTESIEDFRFDRDERSRIVLFPYRPASTRILMRMFPGLVTALHSRDPDLLRIVLFLACKRLDGPRFFMQRVMRRGREVRPRARWS